VKLKPPKFGNRKVVGLWDAGCMNRSAFTKDKKLLSIGKMKKITGHHMLALRTERIILSM